MNLKLPKFGTSVGLAVMTASIAVGLSSCPSNVEETAEVVEIDANLPLTGDLAVYGTSVQDGAIMALEDLEAADSDGIQLNVDWQDNASSPQTAVSIFQQQFLTPPDIYISGVKPQTMAIKEQIDADGIPHFVWIFDAFINQNTQNNFRTWVSYKIEPPIYLNYAKSLEAKRVAIVYVQLPHTVEEFEQIVIPGLKEEGVNEILVEPFDLSKGDFKDIAVKIQGFDPDLIILNGFQNQLVGLVRALRPLDLIQEGNTIATYDMLDASTILGEDELEGIRFVAPIFVTRPDRPEVLQWRERFKERYGEEASYTDAFAYDMVQIIYDAAKRLDLPATSEEWIEALRETDLEGVTGTLEFDDRGDLMTPLEVGVFRDGEPVPLSE